MTHYTSVYVLSTGKIRLGAVSLSFLETYVRIRGRVRGLIGWWSAGKVWPSLESRVLPTRAACEIRTCNL